MRRGSDIFKALALGADFVFMGRVPICGLAVSYDRAKTGKREADGEEV